MAALPTLAVYKFASCDGCQLTLLALEDELIELCGRLRMAYFLEATSQVLPGPYEIALVEGSITTPHDAERIRQVRRDAKYLVTIGACATSGGVQALRNFANHSEWMSAVYARPDYIATLSRSTPIAQHVPVDFELRGCPINKQQLLEVLVALLSGRKPRTPVHAVCLDCKRRGTVCTMVATGTPCLGPITHTGCGALCPAYDRGCYGCFGPAAQPNVVSLSHQFQRAGLPAADAANLLRGINAGAPEFSGPSQRLLEGSEVGR
jgi:coenzyme F420-reducing hydrogenase gamma subunit